MVSPRNLLKLVCDLIEFCTVDKNVPKWHPISITSYNIRESGIDAVQEIAFAFAAGKACCDELIDRGHKIDDFANRLAFHLSSYNDFFEEIAKFRAARRIWYKLMKEKYGAEKEESCTLRFHVQTAGISLTQQQPLINIVRVAYQALAATLGGCQSLHTDSYDEAMSLPSDEAVLVALRTQQILQEETGIGNTIDPIGGSYCVEWLTKEIEERIWDYMDKIDRVGGYIESLESGWAYNEMIKAFYEHQKRGERGEERIVGVNCYVTGEKFGIKAFRTNPKAAEIERERIAKLKRERDNKKVEELLKKLHVVCDKGENVMPLIMELTREGATVWEICDVYRDAWGTWEAPIRI
jgi:methylmalonyl-CoA mutase N-terminal domain/subunit